MNWILATVICVIAALLEGLGGGSDVRARLATLRMPRSAPPLWLWVGIGAFYYLTCLVLLGRILEPRL